MAEVKEITKVSEITEEDIQNYIRISDISDEDKKNLTVFKNVAIDFISSYTGIPKTKIDANNYKLYYRYKGNKKIYFWYDEINASVYDYKYKLSNESISELIEVEKDIDDYTDFIIVVYVLCQDMYDNRILYIDKDNLNKVVSTILGMHSDNLL